MSARLPAPKPKPILNFAELKEDEVKHIAFLNEFLHPNDAKLIYASKSGAKLEPTPAKWGQVAIALIGVSGYLATVEITDMWFVILKISLGAISAGLVALTGVKQ